MARKNLIAKCEVENCIRDKKAVKCWNTARTKFWLCVGKFCSMHYERIRKRGETGQAKPEHESSGGWLNSSGYLKLNFLGKEVYVHQLVWALTHGMHPPKGYHVHHRDGNPLNNVPENLTCVTPAEHRALHLAM